MKLFLTRSIALLPVMAMLSMLLLGGWAGCGGQGASAPLGVSDSELSKVVGDWKLADLRLADGSNPDAETRAAFASVLAMSAREGEVFHFYNDGTANVTTRTGEVHRQLKWKRTGSKITAELIAYRGKSPKARYSVELSPMPNDELWFTDVDGAFLSGSVSVLVRAADDGR